MRIVLGGAGGFRQGRTVERKFGPSIKFNVKEINMSNQPPDEINDPYDDLFGKPNLLEGEDKERYERLRTAVIRDLKPNNIFEWSNALDQVDKLWEEQRYKRATAALISGGLLKALEFYLEQIFRNETLNETLNDKSSRYALQYFSSDARKRKEVIGHLAQFGITIDQLHAKAAQFESGTIQLFDRMVAARENGRRLLRKEAERFSRKQASDPDETN